MGKPAEASAWIDSALAVSNERRPRSARSVRICKQTNQMFGFCAFRADSLELCDIGPVVSSMLLLNYNEFQLENFSVPA